MTQNETEIEVKFYLRSLEILEARLVAEGAQLLIPRVHEVNLRFDTPDYRLSAARSALRLRSDMPAAGQPGGAPLARLTYKGAANLESGASARREIEFAVDSFNSARNFLEALGYRVFLMYEKYRTTYTLGAVQVVLDQLPYGSFCEIEGPDTPSIQAAAQRLSLDWEARCLESYLAIFERLKGELQIAGRDLSFSAFARIRVTPDVIGLKYAD